jgi:hypothetical protein
VPPGEFVRCSCWSSGYTEENLEEMGQSLRQKLGRECIAIFEL